MVKGYKAFDKDMACRPSSGIKKQYSCPGMFETTTKPSVCNHGMHFCKELKDVFDYYSNSPEEVRIAEVIAHGEVAEHGNKCSTNKLEVVRIIPWEEVYRLVNEGKGCSGICNTGNRNTSNRNTGNRNTGNRNTGDWNKTSFSSGCFCTEKPKIMMFNKPSDWTMDDWLNSDARFILNQIPKNVVEWVYECDMTDEEKAANPTYKTTGGYCRIPDETENAQRYWDGLPDWKREIIYQLPNFDKEIFEACTGIKI